MLVERIKPPQRNMKNITVQAREVYEMHDAGVEVAASPKHALYGVENYKSQIIGQVYCQNENWH